jgi:hypothetical protein
MTEYSAIINRVTASSLITVDLNEYYPEGERIVYDIKNNLYNEFILKEKDFREFIKTNDWSAFDKKNVAITCSIEAIVPVWAYMLIGTKIESYAKYFLYGNLNDLEQALWRQSLSTIDPEKFQNAKVVIKGCGKRAVPEYAFVEIVRILKPVVASIMYGEPCSTVPVYKR